MAQHDYIIANQSGAAFRADLNNALSAIVSQNSGASEPSTTYAYQWWADTTTGLLKIRNAANNAWITVGTLADANLGLLSLAGGTLTGALLADDAGTAALPAVAFDGDPNTGIFRAGADQLGIATNGIERVEFGTTEVVFNDGGADIDFRIEGDTNANLFKIDAGTDEVQVANLNGGPLAGTRNRIINGDMRIDQRAAVVTTNGAYTVDRWQLGFSTTGAVQVAKSSDSPSTFSNSLLFDVTTADTSIAAGEYAALTQYIEGFNAADLAFGSATAQTVTLSFWIKSTTTGTYCVSLRNGANNRAFVAEYSVAAANTWEKKTITISGDTSGTWLTDNGVGISVAFAFACGSTFQTAANTWAAGNFLGTSNQVNLLASTANEARITGVQFEPGSVSTPFERRSYGQELALCQRYYEITSAATYADYTPGGVSNVLYGSYAVEKRASPSLTLSATTQINTAAVGAIPTRAWIAGVSSGGSVGSVAATITASIEL